jgi:hypothetical protein
MEYDIESGKKDADPKSLADIVGNQFGRAELSDYKKKSHVFDRKVALTCLATFGLIMGGLHIKEHIDTNADAYTSRLTEIIHNYVMGDKAPINPIAGIVDYNQKYK